MPGGDHGKLEGTVPVPPPPDAAVHESKPADPEVWIFEEKLGF